MTKRNTSFILQSETYMKSTLKEPNQSHTLWALLHGLCLSIASLQAKYFPTTITGTTVSIMSTSVATGKIQNWFAMRRYFWGVDWRSTNCNKLELKTVCDKPQVSCKFTPRRKVHWNLWVGRARPYKGWTEVGQVLTATRLAGKYSIATNVIVFARRESFLACRVRATMAALSRLASFPISVRIWLFCCNANVPLTTDSSLRYARIWNNYLRC